MIGRLADHSRSSRVPRSRSRPRSATRSRRSWSTATPRPAPRSTRLKRGDASGAAARGRRARPVRRAPFVPRGCAAARPRACARRAGARPACSPARHRSCSSTTVGPPRSTSGSRPRVVAVTRDGDRFGGPSPWRAGPPGASAVTTTPRCDEAVDTGRAAELRAQRRRGRCARPASGSSWPRPASGPPPRRAGVSMLDRAVECARRCARSSNAARRGARRAPASLDAPHRRARRARTTAPAAMEQPTPRARPTAEEALEPRPHAAGRGAPRELVRRGCRAEARTELDRIAGRGVGCASATSSPRRGDRRAPDRAAPPPRPSSSAARGPSRRGGRGPSAGAPQLEHKRRDVDALVDRLAACSWQPSALARSPAPRAARSSPRPRARPGRGSTACAPQRVGGRAAARRAARTRQPPRDRRGRDPSSGSRPGDRARAPRLRLRARRRGRGPSRPRSAEGVTLSRTRARPRARVADCMGPSTRSRCPSTRRWSNGTSSCSSSSTT